MSANLTRLFLKWRPETPICLLLFTCNYVVSVWRGFLFLWVLGMGYVILLWHSLSLPYNYFKKGEKYYAANYRPVSLTCICCKSLEHIILSNINKHLAFESILADCQHGFRSQRSCETQLVQIYHDMISNLDGDRDRGQKQTGVIIKDFSLRPLTRYHTGGYCTN